MSAPCDCKICRGEIPDSPIKSLSKCPRCDVPMTYGDTHRGSVVHVTGPLNSGPWEFVHRKCLAEWPVRHTRITRSVHVYPREAVTP